MKTKTNKKNKKNPISISKTPKFRIKKKNRSLHLCTFHKFTKTPTSWAVDLSERGDADCAFTRRERNGVKKRNRTKKIVGGRLYGKGSYGEFLGDPPLPCTGDAGVVSNDYLSKVFRDHAGAKKEYAATQIFSRMGIGNPDAYFVLPLKICDIDMARVSPISANQYKATAWRLSSDKNKRSEYFNTITTEDQILYPKATHDLEQEAKLITTLESLKEFMSKIKNIALGIQLLQQHSIIHGDIKLENCLLIGGTFKIGDLNSLTCFLTNYAEFPNDKGLYLAWPFLSIYSKIIKDLSVVKTPNNFDEAVTEKFLGEQKTKKYSISSDINYTYVYARLSKIMFFLGGLRANTTVINLFKILSEKLIGEDDESKIAYLTYWNTYFLSVFNEKGREGLLKNFYNRIDIYSFGIMLLITCSEYFEKIKDPAILDDKEMSFITRIIGIAGACCLQPYLDSDKKREIKIEDILELLDKLNNNQPDTKDEDFL